MVDGRLMASLGNVPAMRGLHHDRGVAGGGRDRKAHDDRVDAKLKLLADGDYSIDSRNG
jgi:hypothetical protein